jgi:hypothetical protein
VRSEDPLDALRRAFEATGPGPEASPPAAHWARAAFGAVVAPPEGCSATGEPAAGEPAAHEPGADEPSAVAWARAVHGALAAPPATGEPRRPRPDVWVYLASSLAPAALAAAALLLWLRPGPWTRDPQVVSPGPERLAQLDGPSSTSTGPAAPTPRDPAPAAPTVNLLPEGLELRSGRVRLLLFDPPLEVEAPR